MTEGVSKSKETSHTYVEVHFVGESKYGLSVSADCETLATVAVLNDCSSEKSKLNSEEACVCGG